MITISMDPQEFWEDDTPIFFLITNTEKEENE